jgi:predicted acylesterase/phospholipase RssA
MGYRVSSIVSIAPNDKHAYFLYFIPGMSYKFSKTNEFIDKSFDEIASYIGPKGVIVTPTKGKAESFIEEVTGIRFHSMFYQERFPFNKSDKTDHYFHSGQPYFIITNTPLNLEKESDGIIINLDGIDKEQQLRDLIDCIITGIQSDSLQLIINSLPIWNKTYQIETIAEYTKQLEIKPNVFNLGENLSLILDFINKESIKATQSKRKEQLVLVMKGGGIKGLAYVGALEELQRYFKFDWFVGTSAGAIVAILLGCGYNTEELKNELAQKNFNDFRDAGFLKAIWNLFTKGGAYEAHAFTNWLDKLLAKKLDFGFDVKLCDLPNRTTVYASKEGEKALVFDSVNPEKKNNRAAYAARCSMAIPFIFTPEKEQGLDIFDGGTQNNYPVDILLQHNPNTKFVGLYLGDEFFEGFPKRRGIIGIAKKLFSIWTEALDIESLRKYKDNTIIIDPRPISLLDFSLNEEEKQFLLQCGRYYTRKYLVKKQVLETDLEDEKRKLEISRASVVKKRRKKKLIRLTMFILLILIPSLVLFVFYNLTPLTKLFSRIFF